MRVLGAGVAAGLWAVTASAQETGATTGVVADPATAEVADNPIGCTVSGYDVVLTNIGEEPIAEGTTLSWSVPFVRMEGTHVLTSDLVPERTVFMTSVLGANYLRATIPCDGAIVLPEDAG